MDYAPKAGAVLAHLGVRWPAGGAPADAAKAALCARTLAETLRPYAATYHPAVDVCPVRGSVTLNALCNAGINVRRASAALLTALDPSCPQPTHAAVENIFRRAHFALFFQALAALADALELVAPPKADQDPWGDPTCLE